MMIKRVYKSLINMISCYESVSHVLPYRRFLTKSFKEFGIDLTSNRRERVI